MFLSQMGKDVVSFLSWAAEPEMEERKLVTTLQLYHLTADVFFAFQFCHNPCPDHNSIFSLDGSEVDLPTVTSASPSCLLPAHEVVGLEVAQAGPGCCQLRTAVSFFLNLKYVEPLRGSIQNNGFVMYNFATGARFHA
jgi:hypothetical protein